MNKQEFLEQLSLALSGLPQDDIEERLSFYGEIIDDRMDEGEPEEAIIAGLGSITDIVAQIISGISLKKIAKERIKSKRRLMPWEVTLLLLGSPVWISLGVAVLVLVLALYIVLFAVIVALWAVFGSMIACSLGSLFGGIVMIGNSNVLSGVAAIGVAFVCAGLSVFMFYLCKAATKGVLLLVKKSVLLIKSCLIRRRGE